jgi:hypothetical protein
LAFDVTEKERIRYHLGYLNVQPAASITYGLPRPIQTLFLVEVAMDKVLPEGEDRIRKMVTTLDNIECQMIEGQAYLAANRLGELEVRKEHIDQLEVEYHRWASRLADTLGVPLYPFADRFKRVRGSGAGNIPVV